MGVFKNNLSANEGLAFVLAGYAAMLAGVFIFVIQPWGIVVFLIGILSFLAGYYQWSPIKALIQR